MQNITSTMSSGDHGNSTGWSTLSTSDIPYNGLILHRYATENKKKNIKKILKHGIYIYIYIYILNYTVKILGNNIYRA